MIAPPNPMHETSRRPLREGRPRGENQRQLLLAFVGSNPGVHILRASQVLGLNWNTCLHHVRRLEAEGRISTRKVQGRVCLFDRRSGAVAPRIAPVLLRDERNSEIARLLTQSPGLNQRTLADTLGMAASVIHRRLVRMEEAGLVERVQRSREVAVFATEAMHAAYAAARNVAAPVPAPVPNLPAAVAGEAADAPWLAWMADPAGEAGPADAALAP
jgi:hypothetical protein